MNSISKHIVFFFFLLLTSLASTAQQIELLEQFNGRYDFTIIGNTLNTTHNLGVGNSPCEINTEVTADLYLDPSDEIVKAYLYWAGSGPGVEEILLNNIPITAERTYTTTQVTTLGEFIMFGAFADVTEIVQDFGSHYYHISDFDLTEIIAPYCPNAINFGGWAMVVVYKNDAYKLTQLNIYDGLQTIGNEIPITIQLDNLHVIDKVGSKIGFIAWEGDPNISVGEVLKLNGIDLFDPPLNPLNNAFNGTNSLTGSDQLYNMDIDVYEIENYIDNGDTSANIFMNSGQDFVMISTIITKLNSQLPDATVSIENIELECDSRILKIHYTIHNLNSTDILPSGVPISIYANNQFLEYDEIVQAIPIDGSEEKFISIVLPESIPDNFTLTIIVDQNQQGHGEITESNEENNATSIEITIPQPPAILELAPIYECHKINDGTVYNFSEYENIVLPEGVILIGFYNNFEDARLNTNKIYNTAHYVSFAESSEIFIRLENEDCFSISSFELRTKKCPPIIYNLITDNNDGDNDYFIIDGLYGIFENFELEIYNRWGQIIWTGKHNTPPFRGYSNTHNTITGQQLAEGTYYYVLRLNDPEFEKPFVGYIHLTR